MLERLDVAILHPVDDLLEQVPPFIFLADTVVLRRLDTRFLLWCHNEVGIASSSAFLTSISRVMFLGV
jgi:hypothetical protein